MTQKTRHYDVLATGHQDRGCNRFFVDGMRVSYDTYDTLRSKATSRGRIECMSTEIKEGRRRLRAVFVIPVE